MGNLEKYLDKKVEIITNLNKKFLGVISDYVSPEDNENNKESIILEGNYKYPIEFYKNEIKEIKIIQ